MAGTTAQNALQGALTKLVPGAAIADVCEFTDALIDTLCAQTFKTKGAAGKGGATGGASGAVEEKSKGVAFPTCISVNECLRCAQGWLGSGGGGSTRAAVMGAAAAAA
jgi:methionine aminopeptidase